jgi:hypothetical protein
MNSSKWVREYPPVCQRLPDERVERYEEEMEGEIEGGHTDMPNPQFPIILH